MSRDYPSGHGAKAPVACQLDEIARLSSRRRRRRILGRRWRRFGRRGRRRRGRRSGVLIARDERGPHSKGDENIESFHLGDSYAVWTNGTDPHSQDGRNALPSAGFAEARRHAYAIYRQKFPQIPEAAKRSIPSPVEKKRPCLLPWNLFCKTIYLTPLERQLQK